MSEHQFEGEVLTFGRSALKSSELVNLTPDLSRSYQWPFHIRVHPDKWEFSEGRWSLMLERCGLKPGIGGVKGKYGKDALSTLDDAALMSQWAKEADRRWVILPNGDNRLADVFPDGNFLRIVKVQSGGNLGQVIIAAWERVTDEGLITTDKADYEKYSNLIAKHVLKLEGPTNKAKGTVTQAMKKLLQQLETSAQKAGGGSTNLKKRLARLRNNLHQITGDESWAPVAEPEKVSGHAAALAEMIDKYGVDAVTAMLKQSAEPKPVSKGGK